VSAHVRSNSGKGGVEVNDIFGKSIPRQYWLAMFILTAFVFQSSAYANGPEIGRDAGVIFPVEADSVQLVSEVVLASLPNAFVDEEIQGLALGSVKCTYRLRNLSNSAETFDMAFLANRPTEFYRKPDFDVSIDGQPAQVSLEIIDKSRWAQYEAYPPDTLPTWQVSIEPKGEVTILITYAVSWSNSEEHRVFHYHAMPAALWAGKIQQARIEFQIDTPAADAAGQTIWKCVNKIVEPDGYSETTSGVVWEMTNWEPSTDFRLWVQCSASRGDGR